MNKALRPMIIFGAKGMLGHALATALTGYRPLLLDKEEVNLTEASVVRAVFARFRPSCIINAAAYTDVDGAEENEQLAVAVNATAVRTLAELCEEFRAIMVHYSTDYVFHGKQKDGYAEENATHPLNAYRRSKRLGEEFLLQSRGEVLLIRTSWLYGPHGKNFVEAILRRSKVVPELTVVDDQHGKPTYTLDLAQRTLWLLEHHCRGIHHAVNEGLTTWYDFSRAIVRLAGRSATVSPVSSSSLHRKAIRPEWSELRNTKDPLMRSWEEALSDYLATEAII